MTMIFHPCVKCGQYTLEDEARCLGVNERELWLCPGCDVPAVIVVTPENAGLLRSGSFSLWIPNAEKRNL